MFKIEVAHLRHAAYLFKTRCERIIHVCSGNKMVTKLCEVRSRGYINQPPILSTFGLGPQDHGFRTRPKKKPKRGQKIVLEIPQLQKNNA